MREGTCHVSGFAAKWRLAAVRRRENLKEGRGGEPRAKSQERRAKSEEPRAEDGSQMSEIGNCGPGSVLPPTSVRFQVSSFILPWPCLTGTLL